MQGATYKGRPEQGQRRRRQKHGVTIADEDTSSDQHVAKRLAAPAGRGIGHRMACRLPDITPCVHAMQPTANARNPNCERDR